jgi:hypothetical protein
LKYAALVKIGHKGRREARARPKRDAMIRAQNDTNRGINVVQQTQKEMRLNDKERKDKLDISNDRSKSEGREGGG